MDAVREPGDEYSDGALFTHYLLLLFEVCYPSTCKTATSLMSVILHCLLTSDVKVAATGHSQTNMSEYCQINMWQHRHRVLCILQQRREVFGKEPHNYIALVCIIEPPSHNSEFLLYAPFSVSPLQSHLLRFIIILQWPFLIGNY